MKMEIWCEKWRPTKIDDLILPESIKSMMKKFIEQKSIPHLLFAGPPGVGKTTLAFVLMSSLDVERKELNASDERGIDTIREKVKRFMMVESVRDKVVFFDEADGMTNASQESLRNLLEKYQKNCRAIFSVNYLYKIIEPIRSRMQLIELPVVDRKQAVQRLCYILDKEGIKYKRDDVVRLYEECKGDMRRSINELQKGSVSGIYEFKGLEILVDEDEIWKLLKQKSFAELKLMLPRDMPTTDIYNFLFTKIFDTVSWEVAVDVVGEYFYRDALVPDKGLNMFCCLLKLQKWV